MAAIVTQANASLISNRSTSVADQPAFLSTFLIAPTGAVAKKLGRRYLGIEREGTYIRVAERRLAAIPDAGDPSLLETPSKRKQPRIPFGWLVERGMLAAGDMLISPCQRWTAKVTTSCQLPLGQLSTFTASRPVANTSGC